MTNTHLPQSMCYTSYVQRFEVGCSAVWLLVQICVVSGACTNYSALYQSLAASKITEKVKNIYSNNLQSRAGARMPSWTGGQQSLEWENCRSE